MIKLPEKYYITKKYLSQYNKITSFFKEQLILNENKQIQYWNWWQDDIYSLWLRDFIVKRHLIGNSKKTIALCSVFGEKDVLDRVTADVRIFFSGENLHSPHLCEYAGYMLAGKKSFDLSMGFDYFENEHYLRFPLWLVYLFKPDWAEEDIRQQCNQLRFPQRNKRTKFASLIARADVNGVRTQMFDCISKLEKVDCPSVFKHNDDCLKTDFSDNKREYLKQFMFNICPENSNAYGYTTEKLFEAIISGCIPIYWGSYGQPENDILNQNTIIHWKMNGNNNDVIKELEYLYKNEHAYNDFISQPRLTVNAEEIIINYYKQLEYRIKNIL